MENAPLMTFPWKSLRLQGIFQPAIFDNPPEHATSMQNREQNRPIDFEHMDCRPRDIMEEIMNAARNQITYPI